MSFDDTVETSVGPGNMQMAECGAGPRVILVHGGGASGVDAWRPQLPLAARFRLVMPTRPGYPGSAPTNREDFAVDARLLTELLREPAHLVGHSYGAVVAMLAAAERPASVLSLTMMDAACSGVARGDPIVDDYEARMQRIVAAPPSDPSEFVRAVFAVLDAKAQLPDPLPPPLVAFGKRLYSLRWPWEAEMPLERLKAAPFRKLAVSGGRNPLYEVISNVLAARLDAERFVIADAGHSVQNAGAVLNERLETFFAAAS